MNTQSLNRRQFISQTTFLAGAAALTPLGQGRAAAKRTAVDQVTLGKTGIKVSRLGFGAGSNSGNVQFALGQAEFNKLIRHAYDQGITWFDCAQGYRTFEWLGEAIKGLPREKIYIQSKIGGNPDKPMDVIDRHLRTYKTDYVDSVLVHCATKGTWTDETKRLMDALDEAKAKQKVRCKGVSCHSLPALNAAARSAWVDVNLVRVNPQAKWIDGMSPKWDEPGMDLAPVLKELKTMKANGHGIIGMKIIGNGDFQNPDDREKSIRFAMAQPELDAIVIGFKSAQEVDEAIGRMNRALAELPS